MVTPELIPIPRQVLALLVRSTSAMADTYAYVSEHCDVGVTVDDIAGMRAAVELATRAMEGETEP